MKNLTKISHKVRLGLVNDDDNLCGVYIDEDGQTMRIIFKDENPYDPSDGYLEIKFVLPDNYCIAHEEGEVDVN